jgi:alanine racemase
VHLANSAGAIFHSNICKYDLVRGGIAIYGLDPSDTAVLPEGFRPALSWKAGITSIKTVRAGQEISYCGRYQVKQDHARIGVAAVGYADGMCRRLGNFMMVHGKKVPVLGTVCMDQCMIDLNDVPQAQVGDEAVLIGFQEGSRISAEELGESWGTINYDVVCGIASRVQRIYQPETL